MTMPARKTDGDDAALAGPAGCRRLWGLRGGLTGSPAAALGRRAGDRDERVGLSYMLRRSES